jgi:hypothetical protein
VTDAGVGVKTSRRIAQFLVVLLKYEKPEVSKPFSRFRDSRRYQLENFFYGGTCHLVPDPYGHFKAANTLRSTFNRTIRIMLRQGLISPDMDWDIKLTEKGRMTATFIEREARKYIEDFSFLLKRKT